MVDLIPAAAVILHADGTIRHANDFAARLLGIGRDRLAGSSLLAYLAPDSREALLQQVSTGEPSQTEVKLLKAERWLLAQSAPHEHGCSVVLTDVTSYVEREARSENARISAEKRAHSKSEFLGRLSHEIRSALASMIGFADMLREKVQGTDRDLAEVIMRSGRHILDTLNSVMDLARLEFNQSELTLEEVELVDRVRDRVFMFYPRLRDKRITLSFHPEQRSVRARVNPTFVDRVVHNLIDNAIKYTREGQVDVSVAEKDGRAWICVADSGVGIDENFMPRLFAPFERERHDDDVVEEGVGLGLAITKDLVEIMDGKIFARSKKGKGSIFTVSFPAPGRGQTAGEG